MSKVTDEQTQLSDRDWWQEAGNHLNLELHGWTFRNNASFIDRETRQYVPLTGAIAARLIALEAASSTPDGEAVVSDPAIAYQEAEEAICECGAAGSGEGHSSFCPWLESSWKKWGDAINAHPAPIKDGVTVKALKWGSERRYGFLIHEGRGAGYTYEAAAKAYGPGWIVTLGLTTIFNGPDADEAAAKAAAQADFDARILSCLSHNAGEIEAGGEVADADEAYEMGKRDGYGESVQDIDRLTGGDGEYRYVMGGDDDRHTPDATTMKQRIADRFAALSETVGRLRADYSGLVQQTVEQQERIAELEAALRGLLRSEYESAEPGLTDCIDNTGTPYQSQYLADQIKLAEAALKESRL